MCIRDSAYSRQYDLFYDAINDFLTAHGYSTIGFIKGYALSLIHISPGWG